MEETFTSVHVSSMNKVDQIPGMAEDMSKEVQQESQSSKAPKTVTQKRVCEPPDRYQPGF